MIFRCSDKSLRSESKFNHHQITTTSILLVGDFNNWQLGETPIKKSKTGVWSVSLDLETGKEYQYRYLVDGTNWENDSDADKYIPSGLGSENSVLAL